MDLFIFGLRLSKNLYFTIYFEPLLSYNARTIGGMRL